LSRSWRRRRRTMGRMNGKDGKKVVFVGGIWRRRRFLMGEVKSEVGLRLRLRVKVRERLLGRCVGRRKCVS
jgi:hypothetical protein